MEDVSAAQGQESQPTVLLVVSVNGHESALPLSTFECRDVTSGWRDYVGGILASLKGFFVPSCSFRVTSRVVARTMRSYYNTTMRWVCLGERVIVEEDDRRGRWPGDLHCATSPQPSHTRTPAAENLPLTFERLYAILRSSRGEKRWKGAPSIRP